MENFSVMIVYNKKAPLNVGAFLLFYKSSRINPTTLGNMKLQT